MDKNELIKMYYKRLRLSIPKEIVPDGDTLRKLHFRHTLMIPYDNTDYLMGVIKSPDFDTQFNEVILYNRGGMCLDLNPLFGELLLAVGYKVTVYSSTILTMPEDGLNYHIVLCVEDCNQKKWFCDVANLFMRFAESIPMEPDKEYCVGQERFRFVNDNSGKMILQLFADDKWDSYLRLEVPDISTKDRTKSKFGDPLKYPTNPVFLSEQFSIVTPKGRRSLFDGVYRESYMDKMYKLICNEEQMTWAYTQFGLKRKS